jgi:CRISPR system Cascade subunit CasD
MPSFLLFDLVGAMSAWGEIAVGERRGTWDRPSKSAVLGLLAGALGYTRDREDDHRALAEGLGFGVLLFRSGAPLRDFHTAQVPPGDVRYVTRRAELAAPRLGTIVSRRDYLCEGWATAALWRASEGAPALAYLADSLAHPHFIPYLGRKSCPLGAPLRPRVVEAAGLATAFAADDSPAWMLSKGETVSARLYWDVEPEPPGAVPVADREIVRRDGLASRARHQFLERREAEASWNRASGT